MSISTVETLPTSSDRGRGRPKGEVYLTVTQNPGKWVKVSDLEYPHSHASYYRKRYGFKTQVIDGNLYLKEA